MPAKSSISAGFRWVLGNGMKINAVKDRSFEFEEVETLYIFI